MRQIWLFEESVIITCVVTDNLDRQTYMRQDPELSGAEQLKLSVSDKPSLLLPRLIDPSSDQNQNVAITNVSHATAFPFLLFFYIIDFL